MQIRNDASSRRNFKMNTECPVSLERTISRQSLKNIISRNSDQALNYDQRFLPLFPYMVRCKEDFLTLLDERKSLSDLLVIILICVHLHLQQSFFALPSQYLMNFLCKCTHTLEAHFYLHALIFINQRFLSTLRCRTQNN